MLENAFSLIYPGFRNKSGLINMLGTGIKFVTGNMDQNDAIEINNKIDELILNNKNLIRSQNEQVSINVEMMKRFHNITNIKNQQQIEKYFNQINGQIKKRINCDDHDFRYMQYIYQLNLDIDILRSHLDDISECIQLAKLGVISKDILSTNELRFIREKLIEQNVKIQTLEQIYEHLHLQAYYNETKLLFIVKVPILDPELYTEHYVEPIPKLNNRSLDIPYEKIIKNLHETYFIVKKQNEINRIKYYNIKDLINVTNDMCFNNISNYKSGTLTKELYKRK